MEYLQTFFEQFSGMKWSDYLDIIVVAFLLYWLFSMLRSTGATRIAWVVGSVVVVAWLTDLLNLHALNFILNQVFTIGLISIVVLFQPELRRVIDHLTNVELKKLLNPRQSDEQMMPVIRQVVSACEKMSKERIGALIVFARDSQMEQYSKTGTLIDAQSSEHLIRNIFFPKAALHDGAMIIQNSRVLAAGCVLPLSESNRLHADLGTRHRAAVGMSEATDAVIVVVSEETGVISVAVGGMLKRHLAPQTLEKLLRSELCRDEDENAKKQGLLQKLQNVMKKREGGDGK